MQNADEGRVSVRYANGAARVKRKFLFFGSTPKPGPGSTVFVPERLETDAGFDVSGFLRDLESITASVLTVILVIDRIDSKKRAGRVARRRPSLVDPIVQRADAHKRCLNVVMASKD